MRRRWRLAIAAGATLFAIALAPVAAIEGGCRASLPGGAQGGYRSLLSAAERRPEARTWLTYPEWHIVYEADAYARHLASGGRPSGFAYGEHIAGFWRSYCTLNRVSRAAPAAGDAKVMIYTIGISYTVELAVKAAYERTIGRFFEWASGWRSADDRHAAEVQTRYGAFMHETPWYRFPFGSSLADAWRTTERHAVARHWERRVAATAEYGVKAGYARLIGAATGAALGADATSLRFVARATPAAIRSVDARLAPVRTLPGGLVVVKAPRYQQFTDLVAKLVASGIPLVEIAGNDDLLATVLLPGSTTLGDRAPLFEVAAGDGTRRLGLAVKVAELGAVTRAVARAGGSVEHVYDY